MRKLLYMVGLLSLMSCVNDLDEVNSLFEKTEPGVEVATDIEMLYSDSAVVRVRITGPRLLRHLDNQNARDEFPDGIHVDFLERDGTVSSTLDADHANRFIRDKKVVVRSGSDKEKTVILQNILGEKLETSELIWDEAKNRIYTEKFVKITKPEEIIFAYGFTANQDFSEYELKRVVARLKADDISSGFKN